MAQITDITIAHVCHEATQAWAEDNKLSPVSDSSWNYLVTATRPDRETAYFHELLNKVRFWIANPDAPLPIYPDGLVSAEYQAIDALIKTITLNLRAFVS